MMRNLYLYINYKNDFNICCDYKDIYCFKDKLICIDKNIYNKSKRYELQKELSVKPYFVSQDTFKEMLYALINNKVNFKIKDIEFIDESIREEIEYYELESIIKKNWCINKKLEENKDLNKKLYRNILNIIEEFDTEIKSIKFIYSKMDIEITNKGVLNFNSGDELLNNLVTDSILNKMLLGII
ncbi:hypothetical protein KPL42_13145 [Clostridium gasigenes]|uniref:hypothetical protein n=1 Tax=Clostridium gasigenes TaxID=94869 RepID=UPI001C0E4B99|nr:hypothetical protein [Clostridium gasigenes]MBU3089437.1 hypothetical protein [Clostridium gasigenes]